MLVHPTDLSAPTVEGGFLAPFYPPTVRARHPDRALSFVGVTYAIALGYRNLQLDLHVPLSASVESPVPVVVWIHGGAWMFGSRELLPPDWELGSVAQLLIDAGIAVASIDYRHAREAPFPAQLHDVKAAIRYLRAFAPELGLDPERVGVWGESAGGHLAALSALVTDPDLEGRLGVKEGHSRVSVAVCFYPVTDFDHMPSGGYEMPEAMRDAVMNDFGEVPTTPEDEILGGSANASEEGRRAISALTYVTAAAPPFLFIHGAEDRGVPPLQSELLSAALADAGVATELVIVPDAAHVFDGVDPMPQLERAVDFLAKNLVRA